MEDTLYDLVIGNIDGSKLPDMSHFSAAAVTRYQGKQRHIGNLMSLIRLLMEIRKLYSKLRLRIQNWIELGVELSLGTLP